MRFVRTKTEYEDLYDKLTVEKCRRMRNPSAEPLKDEDIEKDKSLNDKQKAHLYEVRELWIDVVREISTFCYAADRYIKKEEILREWQQKDEAKDKFYDETEPPTDCRCRECLSTQLKVISKDYWWGSEDKNQRVLFIFKCQICETNSAYFDDGEQWHVTKEVCPSCRSEELKSDTTKANHKITTHYECLKCSNKWDDVLNLSVKKDNPDPTYLEDRKLYCYSDTVRGYVRDLPRISSLRSSGLLNRDNVQDAAEKAISKIKVLKISEVSARLTKVLAKNSFEQFQLGQPETSREIKVPFTVLDNDNKRTDNEATKAIWKTVSKSLEGTNWRLIRGSIDYRLGIISARLRAYETRNDLITLIKQK